MVPNSTENTKYSETSVIALYFVFSVLFGTMGIMIFEQGHHEGHFKDIGDGLWWCIVTLKPLATAIILCLLLVGASSGPWSCSLALFLRTINWNHFKFFISCASSLQGRSYANSTIG